MMKSVDGGIYWRTMSKKYYGGSEEHGTKSNYF